MSRFFSNSKESLSDAKESLAHKLSLKDHPIDKIQFLLSTSQCYRDIDSAWAITLTKEAERLAVAVGDKASLAHALISKSTCHFYLTEYDEALKQAHLALKIFEDLHDDFGKAISHKNIGCVYSFFSDTTKALEYFVSAYALLSPLPDHHRIGDKNSELGIVLMNIGTAYFQMKQYDIALSHYLKSNKFHATAGNIGGLAECAANIGGIYHLINDSQKAKTWLEEAITHCKAANKPVALIVTLINLSEVSSALGEVDTAIEHINTSIALAEEYNERRYMFLSYQTLSSLFEQKGDIAQAYLALKKSIEIKDQQLGHEMEQKIKSLEIKFAIEESEKTAQLRSQSEQIKKLEEMVTICAWSGQIKMGDKWVRVEEFLQERFGFKITHGITEEMANKMRQEFNSGDTL